MKKRCHFHRILSVKNPFCCLFEKCFLLLCKKKKDYVPQSILPYTRNYSSSLKPRNPQATWAALYTFSSCFPFHQLQQRLRHWSAAIFSQCFRLSLSELCWEYFLCPSLLFTFPMQDFAEAPKYQWGSTTVLILKTFHTIMRCSDCLILNMHMKDENKESFSE